MALRSAGRPDAAGSAHRQSARHPADANTIAALVTLNRDIGRRAAALAWAKRLDAVNPQAGRFIDGPSRHRRPKGGHILGPGSRQIEQQDLRLPIGLDPDLLRRLDRCPVTGT